MALLNIPFDQIDSKHIQSLQDAAVAESLTLDYKAEVPSSARDDMKEFCYDVASFATASGGDLILGIKENDGIPTDICGITTTDLDAEVRRLDQMILNNITPRIPGYRIRAISMENGKTVVMVRVPKSWNGPHMVEIGGTQRFYSRKANSKYLLSVDEIRSQFLLSESTNERIRQFRMERLGNIVAGDIPSPLQENQPRVVVHVLPLSSFSSNVQYPLDDLEYNTDLLRPLALVRSNRWYNLDGLVVQSWHKDKPAGYIVLYTSGKIEEVDTYLTGREYHENMINVYMLEKCMLESVSRHLAIYQKLGIESPIVVMLSLLGVRGIELSASGSPPFSTKPIDRDNLIIPEVVLPNNQADVVAYLRPIFDAIWRSGGWRKSETFSDDGKFRGQLKIVHNVAAVELVPSIEE